MGIISPVGRGVDETLAAIRDGKIGICDLDLFPVMIEEPPPVGEIKFDPSGETVPRTHQLAKIAALEAMAGCSEKPDAIVLGVTTGGMPLTEELLKDKVTDPQRYEYHGTGTVAEYLAKEFSCEGTVITISTACSSGTAAMKIGMELLRCGKARRVLAGGVDALCRLTYHGFGSLQVVDPRGTHPLDQDRMGMTVSEGSGMVLLEASDTPPHGAVAELKGAALSCDAYHPASPHPEGRGAYSAMDSALADAGIKPSDIDYINLHGTGTRDNDLAESKAIHTLFKDSMPMLSSIKGAFGHSLAAAGAIEAVVSAICINNNIVPPNYSCDTPDPELKLDPVRELRQCDVNNILSNSFGFGGNNSSLVMGSINSTASSKVMREPVSFTVLGSSCLTGAGDAEATLESLSKGTCVPGVLEKAEISKNLKPRSVRRLKRLPRLVLSLAVSAFDNSDEEEGPESIYFGTGWGPLSETNDFLEKLFETGELLSSPTDFVGSVHNAPAAQLALHFSSKGPNLTTTGGDVSFEQSLITAGLLSKENDQPLFVIGADE